MSGDRWVPWLTTALCLPIIAVLILYGTAPVACNELPSAFSRDVRTEQWDVDGLVSRCEATSKLDGSTDSRTVINWTGILLTISICALVWLFAAGVVGMVAWRVALTGSALACAIALGALVAFFK